MPTLRAQPIKLSDLYLIEKSTTTNNKWEPEPNAPRMKYFCAAMAWRNMQEQDHYAENWGVVIGESEVGQYIVVEEISGNITKLTREAIHVKDRYDIKYLFVEDVADANTNVLAEADGLTHYKKYTTIHGEDRYVTEPKVFAYFRSRETVIAIGQVLPEIAGDLGSGLEHIHNLRQAKRFVYRTNCSQVDWVLRQKAPFDQVLKHPLCKAMIFCLMSMERMKGVDTKYMGFRYDDKTSYSNRRR